MMRGLLKAEIVYNFVIFVVVFCLFLVCVWFVLLDFLVVVVVVCLVVFCSCFCWF